MIDIVEQNRMNLDSIGSAVELQICGDMMGMESHGLTT